MSDTAQRAQDRDRSSWQGHRVAAMAVRLAVFLCPLSVAVALGVLVSRSISGDTPGITAVRFLATAVVSLLAFVLVERLARRFLPLAALLRLNLVFPDRAPSRFSVALRSTSVRKLQQWVREARASEDAAALAEKVVTLASALNTHDRRTRGHCERTRALADLIVEELHLSPAEANQVRWGAFLHDIGKLVVPPEILNKPGKPTSREWEILKSHPEAGAKLVEPLRAFLSSGVDAVGSHHENFDGSGYPHGLSGDDLPLAARIVSVADSFEVMTAVRAYKRPMTLQAAREELARRSGTQFDPHVVRAFLNVSLGRVHWTLGVAAWVAELPFLTLLPRVAAQLTATAGAGSAATPIALPTIAAASLGAMAVLAPVRTATTGPSSTTASSSSPRASAAPSTRAPLAPVPSSASSSSASSSTGPPGASRPTVASGTSPLTAPSSLSDPAALLPDVTSVVQATVPSTVPSTTVPLNGLPAPLSDITTPVSTVDNLVAEENAVDTLAATIDTKVQAVQNLLADPTGLTGSLPAPNRSTTTTSTLPALP